jgi:hypothetical protein
MRRNRKGRRKRKEKSNRERMYRKKEGKGMEKASQGKRQGK